MSVESVQTIIGRAIIEDEFRKLLFEDPAQALAGYDLSEEETQALKEIKPGEMDAAAHELEERISRVSLGGPHGPRKLKLKIV